MEMALRSSALSATNPCKIPVRPDSLALMIMRRRLSDWQGGREPISGTLAAPESITRNLGGILSLSVCVLLGQKDRALRGEGVNQKTAAGRAERDTALGDHLRFHFVLEICMPGRSYPSLAPPKGVIVILHKGSYNPHPPGICTEQQPLKAMNQPSLTGLIGSVGAILRR